MKFKNYVVSLELNWDASNTVTTTVRAKSEAKAKELAKKKYYPQYGDRIKILKIHEN